MPNDTYTLTISDAGVSIPVNHASTHLTGGTDAIPVATTSTSGLMSAAQATSLNSAVSFIGNGTLGQGSLGAGSVGTSQLLSGNVTFAKIQNISADTLLGRATSSTGVIEQITCTSAGRALIGAANTAAQLTVLGLGTLATQGSSAVSITGGTLGNVTISGSTFSGSISTLSSPLAANNGGTGYYYYNIGDILFANTITTLSRLQAVATGNTLISNGTLTAPSWGKVGLSTHVSGTLPVANGGTGKSSYTIGDLLCADSSTSLAQIADIATGNVLISGGVAASPSWGKVALTTHVSGTLPAANGGTGVITSTFGKFLCGPVSGVATAPTFRAIDVADLSGVTLPVTNGGTGSTAASGARSNLGFRTGSATLATGAAVVAVAGITSASTVLLTPVKTGSAVAETLSADLSSSGNLTVRSSLVTSTSVVNYLVII